MSAIQCDYSGCLRPATVFTSVANIKACKAHRSFISALTLPLKSIRERHISDPPLHDSPEKDTVKKRRKSSPSAAVTNRSSLLAAHSPELLRFCGFASDTLAVEYSPDELTSCVEKFTEQYLRRCSKDSVLDTVIETVVAKLTDCYYATLGCEKCEQLLQCVQKIDRGSKVAEITAMQLVKIYARKEVRRYADAENVLNAMQQQQIASDPGFRYRITEKLATILTLQVTRSKKETLSKYGILRENVSSQRVKQRPLAELLVSVDNLKLHRQLEDKMATLCESFEVSPSEECVASLLAIGEFYKQHLNYRHAQTYFERGLEILKSLKKSSELAVSLTLRLGKIYQKTEQPKKASHLYTGPATAALITPCQEAASLYLRIGDFFFNKEKFNKAKEAYERSLSLLQSIDSNSYTAVEAHLRLVSLHCRRNAIEKAKEAYSQAALIIANLIPDTPKTRARHRSVSEALQMRNKSITTRVVYLSAIANFSENEDLYELKSAIARVANSDKDSAAALELLEKVMKESQSVKANPTKKAGIGLILADELSAQGKWAKAEPLYYQAFDIYLKLRTGLREITQIALRLADAHNNGDDSQTTLKYVETALQFCTEMDPMSVETASINEALGNYLNHTSSFQALDAASYYQSAFDIYKTHSNSENPLKCIYTSLARIYKSMEVHDKLEQLHLSYLSVLPAFSLEAGEVLLSLAKYYHSHGNSERSERLYKDAFEIFRNQPNSAVQRLCILVKLGKFAFRRGEVEQTKACFDEAVSLIVATRPPVLTANVDFFWNNLKSPPHRTQSARTSFLPLYRFYSLIQRFDVIADIFDSLCIGVSEGKSESENEAKSGKTANSEQSAPLYRFSDSINASEVESFKFKGRRCAFQRDPDYDEKEQNRKKAIATADKAEKLTVYSKLLLLEKLRKIYSKRRKTDEESRCVQSIYESIIETGYNHSTVSYIDEILSTCWSSSHQDHKTSLYHKRDLSKRISAPLKFAISIEIFLVQHFTSVDELSKAQHFATHAVSLCFEQRCDSQMGRNDEKRTAARGGRKAHAG